MSIHLTCEEGDCALVEVLGIGRRRRGEAPPGRASAWQIGSGGSWSDDRERRDAGGGV